MESIPLENIVSTRANLGNVQFRVVAYRTDASSADHYAGTAVYKTNGSGVAAIVAKTATPVNSVGQWILGPGTYTFVCYSYGLNSAPVMLTGNWSTTVSHNQDFMLCRKEGVVVVPMLVESLHWEESALRVSALCSNWLSRPMILLIIRFNNVQPLYPT